MSGLIIAVAIYREDRIVVFEDGSMSKMQHFVDRFGDETEDVAEATSAMAPLPNGHWAVIDLTRFEPVAVH